MFCRSRTDFLRSSLIAALLVAICAPNTQMSIAGDEAPARPDQFGASFAAAPAASDPAAPLISSGGGSTAGADPNDPLRTPSDDSAVVSLNAATTNATLDNLADRLTALEQNAAKKEAKPDAKASAAPSWQDLSTDKWTAKIGGNLQGDYINWVNAAPSIPNTQDYFEFRRARLLAEGTGYGVFDFRLQIDVEPEAEADDGVTSPVVELKDAYLTMNEIPGIGRLRFGNFFVPFGLEQVTNDTNNTFLERSIPTNGVFTADREVGMAMYNFSEDKNFSWTFGVFFDSISEALKERVDDNQGVRASGRVTWLPYYDEPSNGRYMVHTGAGFLYTDDQDNRARFRTRPDIHEGPRLIDSGVLAANNFASGNLEFALVWGPISVQSEIYLTSVNLDVGGNASLHGGYLFASYFITGENRIYERTGQHGAQFGRNSPTSNFFIVPNCCSLGAWEAKARVSYLDLDSVNAGVYHDVTAGLNWYWTDRIRVMFDYIHPITNADTTFGATNSDILATRMDYNF